MSSFTRNNELIAKNTLFLYIRMFLALIINLFTIRILLHALGVVDYGILNVIAGFVSLLSFINATLSSSVQRFYNYEGTQHKSIGFQHTYATALLMHTLIAFIFLILFETLGLWYLNNYIVIPSERQFAAHILFQSSVFSTLLMLLQIPFSGAVMAKEKMGYFAFVSIIDVFLKLVIALIVLKSSFDKLILYSVLLSSVSAIDLFLYVFYCKKQFPEMKLMRKINRNYFLRFFSFSSWTLIGSFSFMLKGQGINLLLNLFYGPIINAARGIAYQINSAISGFSSNISTAFGPQIVQSFADNNLVRTKSIFYLETKVCFSLMALIITPTIFEIDSLLTLWLGDSVPEHSSTFSILVLIDSLVCTLNTPCTQVIQATGNIKHYQIGSSVVNLFLIPVCYLLLVFDYTPESIFSLVIIFSCINQIVCVHFTNKQFNINISDYFRQVIIRCFLTILLLPTIPFLICHYFTASLLRIFLLGIVSVMVGIGIVLLCMFNKEERMSIFTFLKNEQLKLHNKVGIKIFS